LGNAENPPRILLKGPAMKSISSSIVAIALFAAILPAQAQQRSAEGISPPPKAVGDPLQLIYRVSGVRDNGGAAEAGTATTFMCTSISNVDETLRIRVRDFNGTIVGTRTVTVPPNQTKTISTHLTRGFFDDATLSPGEVINQGSAAIQATSINIFCSAMIVDAAVAFPEGIALHLVRFNPIAGTEE
jgi:hypothetical protein